MFRIRSRRLSCQNFVSSQAQSQCRIVAKGIVSGSLTLFSQTFQRASRGHMLLQLHVSMATLHSASGETYSLLELCPQRYKSTRPCRHAERAIHAVYLSLTSPCARSLYLSQRVSAGLSATRMRRCAFAELRVPQRQ